MTASADPINRASQHALHSLLNCYLREHAAVHGQLTFDPNPQQQTWPLALHRSWRQQGGYLLKLELPQQQQQLMMLVDNSDLCCNLRYLSSIYGDNPLRELSFDESTRLLVTELCLHFEQPFNDELLSQIHNSRDFIELLLKRSPACQHQTAASANPYIASEQQMTLGHAFHPAPKARMGFSEPQLETYSPEFGQPFQLHYFAVANALLQQDHKGSQSADKILHADLPADLQLPEGFTALPCHPWQADYIRSLQAVQQLLSSGQLIDMGCQGQAFYATSSVRTLYSPDSQHFYKGSLHVRLTNCLRKNAIYELETALFLSRLLEAQQLDAEFPQLQLLLEPAWATVNPQLADADENRDVQEAFALILRQNFSNDEINQYQPAVAGSLFSENPFGPNRARTMIADAARSHSLSFNQAANQWFHSYAKVLCDSVLYACFERGLIFEPHLQNVLLGFDNHMPCRVILRDMEGTKLVAEQWPVQPNEALSLQGQRAMRYSREKGWQRVAYCLFINNLFQAIFHIAGGDPVLRQQLRAQLGDILVDYLERYPNSEAQQQLNAVLEGDPLPNKTNLLIRVRKQADREAGYVPLANPIIAPYRDNAEVSNA